MMIIRPRLRSLIISTLVLALSCQVCLASHLTQILTATEQGNFSFAQPRFEQIGDAESIPDGIITALAQDARGLIWIGTQKGLVRFDGYRFRVFKHIAADPTSIAGEYVQALWAAPDGRIWIGTMADGISVFDPRTDRFAHFRHDEKRAASLSSGRIYALTGDAKGGLWIATESGLDYLAPSATEFIHYRHQVGNPASLLDQRVHSLLLDKAGRLWVGTAIGLQRLDLKTNTFERIADAGLSATMPPGGSSTGIDVRTLFEAQDGKIWIGTREHGAAWLAPDTSTVNWLPLNLNQARGKKVSTELALSHPWVFGAVQISANEIWLATYGGGINIVSAQDGHIVQHLRHDPAVAGSLALDSVKPLLLDRAGLLWVGTWGGGLQRRNSKNKMVQLLRHSQTLANGLSHPDIHAVLERANGQLLFGSDGNGIDIFDRRKGRVGGYRAIDSKLQADTDPLPDATIFSMAETADGSLWIGTQQAGAARLRQASRTWESIPGLPGSHVRRLLKGRDGGLWAATDGGVGHWKLGATRFTAVPDAAGNPMQGNAWMIVEDAQGRVWVASDNGLWVREPGAQGLTRIHHEPDRSDSLASNYITTLLLDRRGQLWLGTDKGLDRLQSWDGKLARFEHVSSLLGRAGQSMGTILVEDDLGRIWSDLAVIEPITMRAIPLTKADGIDIGVIWAGAYLRSRDGLLFFGGTQGVAIVDPRQFEEWNYRPPLIVTELKINGKSFALGDLATEQESSANLLAHLSLNHEQRNFALEFAALDYTDPQKNRYQFHLLGYENEWVDADSEHRTAAYGNLWPGHYTLEVRGSNRLGLWNQHPLRIAIEVLPAFWQTWWFLLLTLFLLSSATIALYRWRTARLKTLVAARTADLARLGQIGQELTATLDIEQAFERVYKQVKAQLDAYCFYIGIYDEAEEQIRFLYQIENGKRHEPLVISMRDKDRPAVWCVRERRELIAFTTEGLRDYVTEVLPPMYGKAMETIAYFPLMLEQRVIGCLSVQNPKPHAYKKDKIEFIRVLSNYTAIAIANSFAHSRLANTHEALNSAHRHLQETQSQLVQQEKMASLGQLIASVAHEINTPLCAIESSGKNISTAVALAMESLPRLFQVLTLKEQNLFMLLIAASGGTATVLNTREERAQIKSLMAQLEQYEIAETNLVARILVQLNAQAIVKDILPLLHHPQLEQILQAAQHMAAIVGNAHNINLSVQRVVKIVFALKSFSRIGNTAAMLAIDLKESVETVLTIYQHQFKQGVELIRNYEELPPLRGLGDELNQVWINLIHNALQAMENKGKLSVGIRRHADAAIVSFTDTGCGIPDEIRARIFDPFFTTKPIGEGSGLGLDIVQKIVHKHHGHIEVRSLVGEGSCFEVHLPYGSEAWLQDPSA
ncbi:MAG: GAF domain-containing protein [Burkholderiales bacterium]|nr:GAF domain-containing protein [Burkholderiales bacterium]